MGCAALNGDRFSAKANRGFEVMFFHSFSIIAFWLRRKWREFATKSVSHADFRTMNETFATFRQSFGSFFMARENFFRD